VRTVPSVMVDLGMAAACVAVAIAAATVMGRIMPFTFFLGAIMLTAWFRGTVAGVAALVLSIPAIDYFVEPPLHQFGFASAYLPRVITFAVSALLLLWAVAARHRAEYALRAARDELEDRVRERTASLEQMNLQLQSEIDERRRSDERVVRAGVRLARAKRRARERVLEARFTAQLEERTRLAREIHDTLLQGFTGVSLQLLAAMGHRNDRASFDTSLGKVLTLAQKTLADARQAVWDMRPPALEEGDFAAALRAELDRSVAGGALALDFVVRGAPRPMPPEVESVMFRVASEAVTNVVRHAHARTVRVMLIYGDRSVRLAVQDDGRGFAVDPDLRTYAGHWGLLGMRERASQLRGRFRVRSAPGAGTKIVLQVPSRGAERGQRQPAVRA
jgi:signal transduction histidine kinase